MPVMHPAPHKTLKSGFLKHALIIKLVKKFSESEVFDNVRVMPDCHASSYCCVGMTCQINNKRILCSKSINNGLLEWDIINKYKNRHYLLYFSYIFLIWPFFKNKKGWITFTFLFVTLLFGINDNNEFIFAQWESKWCYIGVLLPILIICYNKIRSIN